MAKANVTVVPVNRNFEKRAAKDGSTAGFKIGSITSDWEIGTVTINGQVVPEKGVEHLLNFAFQSLQDAYAGQTVETDAVAAFNDKLARILDGTIGVRVAGDGVSAVQAEMRSLSRPQVKAAYDRDNGKDAWKGLDEATRVSIIDSVIESQPDDVKAALNKAAVESIEKKRAEAASKAALIGSIGLAVKL